METANVTYRDETGAIKVRIDAGKCIACGSCITACKHDARYYTDDTERFFADLSDGVPITLIAAPSIRTNISEYKRLFTYFKQLGVNKIYDVSIGADICVWAHTRYIEENDRAPMITQPCPTIVSYCEKYRHDLLSKLSPIHSPMACTSIYVKEYQGINDRIAALSPCISKTYEFNETKLAQYNVTFRKLLEYLIENDILIPDEETDFDHNESSLGSLFPMPGGLKDNIEFFSGKKLFISKAEGISVYSKLQEYTETPEAILPDVFDVLNCVEGCSEGTASTHEQNVFRINKTMYDQKKHVTEEKRREHYKSVFKTYNDKFDLKRFTRGYKPIVTPFPQITDEDISGAFEKLGKTDFDKKNIDCGACGSDTCYSMARKIALGVNIPGNCLVKSKEDAKAEHDSYILAHEQLIDTERQRIEAEAASRAKSAFLSTMSHEIRTPMNAILGITEIQLLDESLSGSVREALSKIYASGDLLLGIINDILDLSKIESGKPELKIAQYDIASLVNDTAQLNIMRIGSKPIEFELYADENMPSHLSGDELRIKQIMNNLLSNAFKYTKEGIVKLSVTSEPIEGKDDSVMLVLTVSDTGQGMTKEQVSRLFDEYARFNVEANRTTEGTGLGMSITRNLVALMNGEILVESEPEKGSEFTVRLPQGIAAPGVLGRESVENLRQFRTSNRSNLHRTQITRQSMPYGSVLIVDDVETNIYVARGLMAPYKLKIDTADSGFAAIEKIKNGNVYDIIFMDHMMPKMDGVEATRIIRGMGYERPIVALTANAVSGQEDNFLLNGFDDFISKPVDIRQLNKVLNRLIRDRRPQEATAEAANQTYENDEEPFDISPLPDISPRFAEILVRDVSKAIASLESLSELNDYSNADNMKAYIIIVHGMKGALANFGIADIAAAARELEIAGRKENYGAIASNTPAFINSLRALNKKLTS